MGVYMVWCQRNISVIFTAVDHTVDDAQIFYSAVRCDSSKQAAIAAVGPYTADSIPIAVKCARVKRVVCKCDRLPRPAVGNHNIVRQLRVKRFAKCAVLNLLSKPEKVSGVFDLVHAVHQLGRLIAGATNLKTVFVVLLVLGMPDTDVFVGG